MPLIDPDVAWEHVAILRKIGAPPDLIAIAERVARESEEKRSDAGSAELPEGNTPKPWLVNATSVAITILIVVLLALFYSGVAMTLR